MTGIPYLMYHRIGAPADSEDRYAVTDGAFRTHLNYLQLCGYDVTSVGKALERPASMRPRIVLTFDDGYESDLTVAASLLADHGFSATFYVVPGLLGRPGYLTKQGVVELAKLGFEVGSHSLTHSYLNDLDTAALDRETGSSRARLEDILGRRVRHFACPGGRYNSAVVEAVQRAGYESMATSHVGLNRPATDRFGLRRLAIQNGTSIESYAHLCRGFGLTERLVREMVLGAAKSVLGNGRYDRVRRTLLKGA
jgi:peptidoglycan/xylan/chitin deacetylase (PgdA/CDA1 family)